MRSLYIVFLTINLEPIQKGYRSYSLLGVYTHDRLRFSHNLHNNYLYLIIMGVNITLTILHV